MALFPHTFTGKETLQPGARGEAFQANLPGYRRGEDRINRTNNKLATSPHDVPNIKWELDRRLPVLFTYGYAHGYNHLVMPKGRIVALDKHMNQLDFDTHKSYNVLTLANGGKIVKLGADQRTWEAVETQISGNDVVEVGTNAVITVDAATGKVALDGVITSNYRMANNPLGIVMRNEYTRDDDAFNGMQPGAVLTDCMVEMPLFLDKDKAEQNPWGSIYGNVLPGDYVKSDQNGRYIPSKLNDMVWLASATAGEIEIERQQVVGQIYDVQRDLVPAGAARYAQWALSDRMKFDQFNPEMFRGNNRRFEDINERSPYRANGGGAVNGDKSMTGVNPFEPQGYPYDQTMTQHDLHMLASTARKNDLRYGLEHQLENGIPGLTDGYNAVTREMPIETVGTLHAAAGEGQYVDSFMKMSDVNLEKGSIKIAVTTKEKKDLLPSDFVNVTMDGQPLLVEADGNTESTSLVAKYVDELQGFLVVSVADQAAHHAFMTANSANIEAAGGLHVYVQFSKRGLSGVPTFLDWDGCQGYCSILLQK